MRGRGGVVNQGFQHGGTETRRHRGFFRIRLIDERCLEVLAELMDEKQKV
jgi:hypothetical protein